MAAPTPPLARLLDAVADALAAVRAGRSLTEALAATPAALRPGTQALAFQALRHLGAALVLRPLLAPKAPPPKLEALLLAALALLWPDADQPPPYAPHTLVDQAVAAARRRQPSSAGFINAVLRRFLREQAALVEAARRDPQAQHQHPAWWTERVRADWPAQWTDLLAAANRHPPMVLRVKTARIAVADYLAALAAAGHGAHPCGDPLAPEALALDRPCPVLALPGWDAGWVSVQDLAAQRAARLLLGAPPSAQGPAEVPVHVPAPGQVPVPVPALPPLPLGARVLDACAAPGGKTAHLLEQRPDLDLLALDADADRLARVRDTLARLGLAATLQAADARAVARWWDGRPFDAILLDAPCSASGIVRRHPDVRWLRRPGDLAALAATQAELLAALWPLLKPGGRLLYATCSIFRAEGQSQIDAFLQRPASLPPRWWPGSPGHQLGLPDNPRVTAEVTGDGFFYALLTADPAPTDRS